MSGVCWSNASPRHLKRGNNMPTLREAIQANSDKLFNDGARTWDADNLLDTFAHAGSESLVQAVYVDERGIFAFGPDGSIKSVPLYRFEMSQVPFENNFDATLEIAILTALLEETERPLMLAKSLEEPGVRLEFRMRALHKLTDVESKLTELIAKVKAGMNV